MSDEKLREAAEKALDCLLYGNEDRVDAIKALEQALQPEPRFYKGQQVLCSNDGKNWKPDVLTKITGINSSNGYWCKNGMYWHCKPDPNAETLINWMPGRDGISVVPADGERINFIDKKGRHISVTKPVVLDTAKIEAYAIIKAPQWL